MYDLYLGWVHCRRSTSTVDLQKSRTTHRFLRAHNEIVMLNLLAATAASLAVSITPPNTSLATVPVAYFGGNSAHRNNDSIEMLASARFSRRIRPVCHCSLCASSVVHMRSDILMSTAWCGRCIPQAKMRIVMLEKWEGHCWRDCLEDPSSYGAFSTRHFVVWPHMFRSNRSGSHVVHHMCSVHVWYGLVVTSFKATYPALTPWPRAPTSSPTTFSSVPITL